MHAANCETDALFYVCMYCKPNIHAHSMLGTCNNMQVHISFYYKSSNRNIYSLTGNIVYLSHLLNTSVQWKEKSTRIQHVSEGCVVCRSVHVIQNEARVREYRLTSSSIHLSFACPVERSPSFNFTSYITRAFDTCRSLLCC